jgi:uncharacterized protein (DUF58 family)
MTDVFFLLIFLFAMAILLRMDWVYYLVYVVGGVWLFSNWWVKRSLRHLNVGRNLPGHAFYGETIAVDLRLTNRSRLPLPWLYVQETVPLNLQSGEGYQTGYRSVMSLGSRSATHYHYTLFCRRRGYYSVGPLRLSNGDLFGFVQSSWQELAPMHITVYPQVLPLSALGLPSRLPFGSVKSRQRLFEDPTRMAGVRQYTTGDSMRLIHWKASAHEDSLLVKKFDPAISLTTTVVLDLNRSAYPEQEIISGSEWGIVVAASLANHMTERRQAVGLFSNGLDLLTDKMAISVPPRLGRGHLMTVLDLLARIELHDLEQPLEQWLPNQAVDLEWGTTLLLVTPHLSEKGLWSLHTLYRRGLNATVLICARQPGFDRIRGQAEKLGIPMYQTIWNADLLKLGQRNGVRPSAA